MIKICSLDFLNKDSFEADVMTADGRVLFKFDDKVTPEKLLILYFKEIYVKEPLVEKTPKQPEPTSAKASVVKEARVFGSNVSSSSGATAEVSGPKNVETHDVEAEVVVAASSQIVETSAGAFDKKTSSPRIESSASERTAPEEEVVPEDPQLVFDEDMAKRISKCAVQVGEILGFSKNELQVLEQAAYYHNIGISNFKKSDSLKKGFRKRKAAASYDMILGSLKLPEEIADIARSCAYDYDCNAFALDSKVPHCHIISVISSYEEILSRTQSKQEALSKMVQLGGDKFNIFVLHKFIRIMREKNE